ncbi:hypothetical protein H1R20_g8946, partial [Candolleomyces eurysporus]
MNPHKAQDPQISLRQDLPARQVLNNQELACLMVGFLEDGYTSDNAQRRKNLLMLAVLNHAFYHAGTEALWRSIPSLSPFLRLLPQLCDETSEQSENVTQAIKADPWSRFRFYSPKTTSIVLVDDADMDKTMPLHWFNFLLNLPSRPTSLFPRLVELTVGSLRGVNSVIPFQVSRGLRTVSVSNFSKATDYETLGKGAVTSLVTNFAFNAPWLSELAIESPLTDALRKTLCQYSALEAASFTVSLPFNVSQISFLKAMNCCIRSLSLFPDETEGVRSWSSNGTHLTIFGRENAKASIAELKVTGDGTVVFQSTAHDDGVFAIPQILHRLSHSATQIAELSFERSQPDFRFPDTSVTWYEERLPHFLPEDVYEDFTTRLGRLTTLSLKYIPFLDPAFTVSLVSRLSRMPQLQTLCLLPVPFTSNERHRMILPTLECLRTLSSANLDLRHLTISLDMSTFPSNIPTISLPGHSLETLFIMPYYSNQKPPVSDLVALATYLDHLFPHLQDIASFFYEKQPCPSVEEVSKFAVGLWKDVAHMITPYQSLRKHVESQLVQNLFGGER